MTNGLRYKSLQQNGQDGDTVELDNISLKPVKSEQSSVKSMLKSASAENLVLEPTNKELKAEKNPPFKSCRSILHKLEGKLLILAGGSMGVFVFSLTKHMPHIPAGEFAFSIFGFSLLTILPILFFQEKTIDTKGKLKFVMMRVVFGGLAGVLKVWSAGEMDFGDVSAIFSLCPLFASVFSRILWKEKLNIFTIVSLCLGLVGMVLVAQPEFVFGLDSENVKTYSTYFPLVPIFGAVCLGLAFSCMRKVGTEINSLVIPFFLCHSVLGTSTIFHLVKGDKLVLPGCNSDKLMMWFGGLGLSLGLVLLNKGLALEKSGPGVLIRNFDIVLAYGIQVIFFDNTPQLLSICGSLLILSSIVLVTINKLFLDKFNIWEF